VNWFQKLCGVKNPDGSYVEEGTLRALYKRCISIAWPSTVEGVLISLVGSVDTMMVGTLGAAAITAVGLTNQPRMILMVLAQAICTGTTSICARRKGAENKDGANSCLMQSLVIVTLLGLVMSLFGFFCAEWLMHLAGANQDTLGMSSDYFRIISLGIPFNCWTMCICAALRAVGDTKVTMRTNVTANLVNVSLNAILINGLLGFPAMGVVGAAIATFCGAVVSTIMAIAAVLKKGGYYRFSLPKFDKVTLEGLFKVGTGSIAESVCMRIGFFVLARMIAGTGTEAFAAYQIASQVTTLSFVLGDGAAIAGTALVGQSLGAGDKKQAMTCVGVVRRIGVFLSIGLMILIFALRKPLAMLFTDDPTIIFHVSLSFLVAIVGMMPQNGRVIYAGCLRGAGDVKYVAWVALVSVAILRPVITWFFCYPMEAWFPGCYFAILGPWYSFVLDAYAREWMYKARVVKGKWLDTKLA